MSALACVLAPAALADFPYTDGPPGGGYDTYRLAPGHVPNDLGGDDWKLAATPEATAPPTILASPNELNGVRGAHVVDSNPLVQTAWMRTTGRPDVSIAVLDSGIEWNNATAMDDLRFKVRLNRGELPVPNHGAGGPGCASYHDAYDANGDGIFNLRDYLCDTRVNLNDPRRVGPPGVMTPQDLLLAFSDGTDADHNGYVDDIAGWDFLDNDNDPYDDVQYGHGTGEARDSSAEANDGHGSTGTCPNCTVVPLRVGDSFVADVNRFAQAALYAVDNNVQVIQEALGTLNMSQLGRRAVDYAYNHGVTVIASAADEAAQHHNWPSTYAHTIVVNSVVKYDESITPANRSYLQFNGCTNFSTKVTLSIPSSSCSSNATGLAAGYAGLIYSEARNANLPANPSCTHVDGSKCQVTPNEVRQLMASGTISPGDPGRQSPDEFDQADDVNFQTGPEPSCTPTPLPGCTDPNRLFPQTQISRPIVTGFPLSRSYPARKGFDEFYGYGRANIEKALAATAAGRIPPEAEITSPNWFEQVDPDRSSVDVRGQVWARGRSYTCKVEVAPGSEPTNDVDFREVPSGWCDGSSRTDRFDGTLANLDLGALKARFPPGTDFHGANPPPSANVVPDGIPHLNNRPNVEPYGFVVRVVVTSKPDATTTLTGQDRRNLFLHHDADLLPGFPRRLTSDGASSPVLADLDGDNRNELIFGTSDGVVHALRPNGTELRGWPVRGDALPLHRGAHAFASGEVPPDTSRGAILASVAVGDVNHDGAPEVVAADLEGKVYVWRSNGRLLWKHQANPRFSGKPLRPFENVRKGKRYRTQHGFIASPVLANLDASPDGKLEVIAAGMDRHVYAWHANGKRVNGFPTLVIDRDKISAVDPVTHAPTFKAGIGDELNQGAIIDTPAVGDLNGDGKPEIVVGTNEEYPAGDDGGFNAGVSTPTAALLGVVGGAAGLHSGNSRLYAIKSTGDPGPVALDNSPFLWKFRVGLLITELLPVVGEGITGSPVIGKANCGGDATKPKVGVMPDAGLSYLLKPDGTSCYGEAGGRSNALATDFSTGGANGKYDTPDLAVVGHPAFGRIDPGGAPTFLAPTAGLMRAIDAAVNEYQGGQDLLAAWDPATGQFRAGWPTPVNDLQFLTGPSTADVDGSPGEEVLSGSSSEDLNAFGPTGMPASSHWPKFTGDWMVANPAAGSFGTLDTQASAHKVVIAITRAGTVFAYRTPAPACSPGSWPRFHHDDANSGDLERDAVAPGVPYAVKRRGGTVSFRAPGDDLLCGTAKRYEVVQSDRRITGAGFDKLLRRGALAAPVPAKAGTLQTLRVPRHPKAYLAFRAVDDQGNVGRMKLVRLHAAKSRLRLSVSPRRVRAGRRYTFRFRAFVAGTRKAVRGATIRFAGRRLRTNRHGRATVRLTLRRPGLYRARASRSGVGTARANVRAIRRGRYTG